MVIMKLGWSLSGAGTGNPVRRFVEECLLCEKLGLDSVWMPDYQAPGSGWPEMYVILSVAANETRKVTLGSLVTDVLRRHPMVIAHAFATFSQLAPGRIVLGLGGGAGTSHYPYGIDVDKPYSRLKEGLEVIKLLLSGSGSPLTYKGRYFSLRNARPPLEPRGRVPVYLASYGPRMLRLTGEKADGWLPESHTPETYGRALSEIVKWARRSGRREEEVEPCHSFIYYPFEPDEKAMKRLLRAAKYLIASYPDVARALGLKHPGCRVHELASREELWRRLAEGIPDSVAERTILYGGIEDCIDKISRFAEAGCRHAILEPYWIERGRVAEAIRIAGERIKPYLLEYERSR